MCDLFDSIEIEDYDNRVGSNENIKPVMPFDREFESDLARFKEALSIIVSVPKSSLPKSSKKIKKKK